MIASGDCCQDGLPGQATNIAVATQDASTTTVKKHTLTITWDAPTDPSTDGRKVNLYRMNIIERYGNQDRTRDADDLTRKDARTLTFANAKYNVRYVIEVRARNANGWGPKATKQVFYLEPATE